MHDSQYMARALALAELGRGSVEPNPLVGAILVKDGRVIGEGYHAQYGGDHAEIAALKSAGSDAKGSTLYVTLEPCCHFGKTPPCTNAVIAAGISEVVVAVLDPFEKVAGRGVQALEASGIPVQIGMLKDEATMLNRPFFKRVKTGRPYVHAKWAMSLDGRIATRSGDSKWISSEAARAIVHKQRGLMDAIITGRGTLLADDPLLTARPPGPRTATRIVLSSGAEPLPADCQLLKTIDRAPVLLAVRREYADRHAAWQLAGAEILGSDSIGDLLDQLGTRGMTNVWLEGGAGLLGSFFDAGEIDEVHAFVAPILIGGREAISPIGGLGAERLAEAFSIKFDRCVDTEPGFYWHGYR